MSLGTRIAWLVGAVVLLATVVAGTGVAVSSRSAGTDVVDVELRRAAAVIDGLNEGPGPEAVQALFSRFAATCARDQDDVPETVERVDNEPPDDRRGPRNEDPPPRRGRDDPSPRPGRFFDPASRSGLQLIRPNGEAIAGCLAAFSVADDETMIASTGTGEALRSVEIDGDRYRVLTVGYGPIGAVQFVDELQVVESAVDGLVRRIIGFGLVGALLAAAIGWYGRGGQLDQFAA